MEWEVGNFCNVKWLTESKDFLTFLWQNGRFMIDNLTFLETFKRGDHEGDRLEQEFQTTKNCYFMNNLQPFILCSCVYIIFNDN